MPGMVSVGDLIGMIRLRSLLDSANVMTKLRSNEKGRMERLMDFLRCWVTNNKNR